MAEEVLLREAEVLLALRLCEALELALERLAEEELLRLWLAVELLRLAVELLELALLRLLSCSVEAALLLRLLPALLTEEALERLAEEELLRLAEELLRLCEALERLWLAEELLRVVVEPPLPRLWAPISGAVSMASASTAEVAK